VSGLYAAAPGLVTSALNRRRPFREFAAAFAEARRKVEGQK